MVVTCWHLVVPHTELAMVEPQPHHRAMEAWVDGSFLAPTKAAVLVVAGAALTALPSSMGVPGMLPPPLTLGRTGVFTLALTIDMCFGLNVSGNVFVNLDTAPNAAQSHGIMCHSAIGNLQCLLHTLHEVIDVVVDIWQVGQLCHGPQMASNGMSQTASNDTHMAAAQ